MEMSSKNLVVYLGGKKILNDLSLHIKNKEFVGIIGPNGSGKSTLLKALYRTLRPNSGTIYIDDKNIDDISLKETAKKIAVVAQHNDSDFDFSVIDMVLIGRTPHKKFMERDNPNDYKIALESLEKVGMTNFSDRSFNSLSGGEKQRVILARALAQETKCLILDEPTNHLDIKYQLQFMSIAKSLEITVISAIHDLNIAALYCDKIYAMKSGEIIDYGTPKEVLTKKLIKVLYEVDSEVNINKDTNTMNIVFKPFEIQ
ncbi:ABC transporter ATP-binding protein [Tissierella pigra]|uniref:ABC transporter ATP-binding protein n=1 Tax=Tissierella pigra TaxID=2607614 RepID=A0A6N7XG25_9FIRM|nr:ABC transporter ATP-binding protein [Tissierella pigra]MSU00949.1 ABC transporter ATP-binding protein [Tissierella pigra]